MALWPGHGIQWEKERLQDALMGFVQCGRDVTGIGVAMASKLLMFIGNEQIKGEARDGQSISRQIKTWPLSIKAWILLGYKVTSFLFLSESTECVRKSNNILINKGGRHLVSKCLLAGKRRGGKKQLRASKGVLTVS